MCVLSVLFILLRAARRAIAAPALLLKIGLILSQAGVGIRHSMAPLSPSSQNPPERDTAVVESVDECSWLAGEEEIPLSLYALQSSSCFAGESRSALPKGVPHNTL